MLCLTYSQLLINKCSYFSSGPPKQISPHQARQVAKVGQSKKKFLCPVDADPPPIFIQWLKDGDPVSDVWTRFRVNDNDGSLRIKDIELEDAGKYVCKATNGFGSIMVNYSLIVVGRCFFQFKRLYIDFGKMSIRKLQKLILSFKLLSF